MFAMLSSVRCNPSRRGLPEADERHILPDRSGPVEAAGQCVGVREAPPEPCFR